MYAKLRLLGHIQEKQKHNLFFEGQDGDRSVSRKATRCSIYIGTLTYPLSLFQLVCRVEVVGLASVGCVGNVILGQLLHGSENRVGTACAKCRMKREVVHQMSDDILYA